MRSLNVFSFLALIFTAVAGAQIVLDPSPARVVGHPSATPAEQLLVTNLNPNFSVNGGLYSPAGVALDTSGSSPILYVADTGNNRILAWQNATSATITNLQPPDLIVGQPDACTTLPAINGGLNAPTGLVVDAKGNLYIADSGNNRVLRYPAPFASSNIASCPVGTATTVTSVKPDIVLGQPDMFTSRSANQGVTISAKTLYLASGNYVAALAVDGAGNLYVTDAGNRRVLQYSAAALTSGASDPAAAAVIGQVGFTVANGPSGPLDRSTLYTPAGLAFDSAGRLFVSDSVRLLVFAPPFSNGMAASRLAGIVNPTPSAATASTLFGPEGVVMINNGPAVLDAGDNRLLIFDAFTSSDWGVTSGDTTLANPPPAAIAVLGQGPSLTNFSGSSVNAGNPQASSTTFSNPVAAAVAPNGDLFVVDVGNNRVLVYPNAGKVAAASSVLGQSDFPYDSPNSIHGREFYFGNGSLGDAGIAVDSSTSTPRLYVSDPNNHRVLGFADARKIGPGVQANIVIGEPNMYTAIYNYDGVANAPGTEKLSRQPTQDSLCYPTGLAVDPSSGDLFVADSGNGRVLRFPAPFAPKNSSQKADLVLGQSGFTGISNPQASQSVMVFPYGLVFDPARGLLVSDGCSPFGVCGNRVLLFSMTNPTNGEPAATVIGQPNFVSTSNSVLNSPHLIAEDSIGDVYVADSGHNQILVFNIPSGTSSNTPINTFTGLNRPQAVWVNPNNVAGYHDDIWVGDASGLSRYPVPNPLINGNTPTLRIPPVELTAGQSLYCSGTGFCTSAALAVTQDGYGNLYVADASNRVGIHYQALVGRNSANYECSLACALLSPAEATVGAAPGAFISLFLFPGAPALPAKATTNYLLPVPTTLGGVQVLVNGHSSPISYAGPNQINFLVPLEAPTSGTAQVAVIDEATSRVLGSGSTGFAPDGSPLGLKMAPAAPAFYTVNGSGKGQIAAQNCNKIVNGQCDDALNGTANPINQGSIIQLYLNGQGLVPNGPPDGQAASGAVSTRSQPAVYIGSTLGALKYSGLAPGNAGLWQINVQIPSQGLTNLAGFPLGVFPVLVSYQGLASNPPASNGNPSLATTIVINAPQ